MNDPHPAPRRSPTVVLLDAMLGLVTAIQTGNFPGRRPAGRPASPRRAGPWLTAGVLVVAGGTAILIGVLMGAPGSLTGLPKPGDAAPPPPPVTSIAAPATTTTSPVPARSSASAPAARAVVPDPASGSATTSAATNLPGRLTAAYAAADGSGILGYRATVTLHAQGPGPSTGWRLTITLPRPTLQIAAVSGATVEHDGAVWTFTPDAATRRIAAGASATVAYEVLGATLVDAQPTACRVDDVACSGLPGGH
ncbi:hypothetical protein [Actinoplanes subtropicus]|uniref:hypothetical protein n=1 Tax=Actinoplanes subtropicus TaxID=543632 RepID=UPI0004C321FC|nr:hypothetical protein [Actinoplanes subtropicus]